jgi:hypothetical protein
MRTLCLLIILACFAATAKSQLPADVAAPEDSSFISLHILAFLSYAKISALVKYV